MPGSKRNRLTHPSDMTPVQKRFRGGANVAAPSKYYRRYIDSWRFYVSDLRVFLQVSGRGAVSQHNGGQWSVSDLESIQKILAEGMEAYQNSPNPEFLRDLALKGWSQYRRFVSGLTNARSWWERVVKTRRDATAPIWQICLPADITIPFPLFFVKNPNTIKSWKNYEDVVQHFLGVHCHFSYKFDGRDTGLQNPMYFLCARGQKPKIVHVVDESLEHAKPEKELLHNFGRVVSPKTVRTLVNTWRAADRTHIVHWTVHLEQESNSTRRYLSFTGTDGFRIEDMSFNEKALPSPPLLFLNTCQSGTASLSKSDNFVLSWFPKYASGAIATFTRVGDELASKVATGFYTYFNSDKPILECLHHTTATLAQSQARFLPAIAYSMWEVDPFLTLYPSE